jgi:hypothetical protein
MRSAGGESGNLLVSPQGAKCLALGFRDPGLVYDFSVLCFTFLVYNMVRHRIARFENLADATLSFVIGTRRQRSPEHETLQTEFVDMVLNMSLNSEPTNK